MRKWFRRFREKRTKGSRQVHVRLARDIKPSDLDVCCFCGGYFSEKERETAKLVGTVFAHFQCVIKELN